MAEKLTDIIASINNVEHRTAILNIFTSILGMDVHSRDGYLHLGNNGHTGIDSIKFNLNPTIVEHTEGQMHWDADNNTLSIGMIGGEVELQVGQEMLIRVFNNTGADIANGAAVYIVDAGDQKPRIALAQADADPTGYVIGLATETIENSTQGFICTQGLVRGLDTNTYTEGLPVYLSATEAGALTETEPEVPNFSTLVGYTIRSHNSLGTILVSPRVVRRPTVIKLVEVTTPSAIANIGQVYTKTDNKLYFQDGAGVEHEIAFVP
jgi:hypothetical protein